MTDELWRRLAEGGFIVERRGDEEAKAGDTYRILAEFPARVELIDKSPAVPWAGKGGEKERLESLIEEGED